jgi:hypothetical protein
MKRLLVGLFLLTTFVNAYSVEPSDAKLPIISLPVRAHLVQSETIPDMHTTLVEADIRRIFVKVNSVWAQAGIQFEIESMGPAQAVAPMPEARCCGTLARDVVRYAVPFDFIAHRLFVRPDVEKIFKYHAEALKKRFGDGRRANA